MSGMCEGAYVFVGDKIGAKASQSMASRSAENSSPLVVITESGFFSPSSLVGSIPSLFARSRVMMGGGEAARVGVVLGVTVGGGGPVGVCGIVGEG